MRTFFNFSGFVVTGRASNGSRVRVHYPASARGAVEAFRATSGTVWGVLPSGKRKLLRKSK